VTFSQRLRTRFAPALMMALVLGSCAYYNTFYTARKYYDKATAGQPYVIDKAQSPTGGNEYVKSIEYSKKVLAFHSKSKWVDDAYLLWARALLGRDDPLQTVSMLENFPTRFPGSPLIAESKFYLGVGYRQARKYRPAIRMFDEFLESAPKHDLAPYAYYERSRCLISLNEPAEAAISAGHVVDRYPKHSLVPLARVQRAEALYQAKDFEAAGQDFRRLGVTAPDDEQRLRYLLREAECLEGAREYDQALVLLEDAISHEREPLPPDTTGGKPAIVQQVPGWDRWGRLELRIGSVHLASGRIEEAIRAYERVVQNLPRTPLADEANYRIGYAWETVGDDFDKARASYQVVRDRSGGTGFGIQASERLRNLERIARFRAEAGDSVQKESEAGFLVAELYLFQLEKPERAIEEYRKVEEKFPDTPIAAKAMNAEAWVLARKLDRGAAADSLLWKVVREHPGTEAQIAARDYLEERGHEVPSELIVLPLAPVPVVAEQSLTPPPAETPRLGQPPAGADFETLGPTGAPLPYRMTIPDSATADTAAVHVPRDTVAIQPPSFAPTARDSMLRRGGLDSAFVPPPPVKER